MTSLEPVLVALARRQGSRGKALELTTAELGGIMGVSQQTASRYLKELDGAGLIRRVRSGRGFEVRMSPEGADVLRGIHSSIGAFLELESRQSFDGAVASGIGEGAYYVGEYAERIHKAVGYSPYPGTLNIRFDGEKPWLKTKKTVDIPGFSSGGRSFGGVGLTPVRLQVRKKAIDCHVIIPERTHHRRDIELVAAKNLRETYGLEDGDKAVVTLA
jgi:riboflavin kinase, archaea type